MKRYRKTNHAFWRKSYGLRPRTKTLQRPEVKPDVECAPQTPRRWKTREQVLARIREIEVTRDYRTHRFA